MTREQVAELLGLVQGYFPTSFRVEDKTTTVNAWYLVLEDQNAKKILTALKCFVRNDKSGFPPTVGQLMNYKTEIETSGEMSSTEAWMLVTKAIRNSTYHSVEEFEKLPPRVQNALGSPSRLQAMAMNSNFNEGYEMRDFESRYNTLVDVEQSHQRFDREAISMMNANENRIGKDDGSNLLEMGA